MIITIITITTMIIVIIVVIFIIITTAILITTSMVPAVQATPTKSCLAGSGQAGRGTENRVRGAGLGV